MGFTAVASPRSPCVLVNAQPSRSLAAVTTRRVALGSAAHTRGWTCNGILPVDFHPTSEKELDVGPLPPSLGSMVRTLNCPKLIAEKMKPRPRTPGNTLGLRRALSSMQAITSATNRSLAERREEGRLQQMQPMVTKKDQQINYKGGNLIDKKKFVKIDQYSGSGHNLRTENALAIIPSRV
jgi:hypothetical protein